MGQDRRARRAKFGTARPCRAATLGKGREASGARPQPETARERTQTYVTEPDAASHAKMPRRASYRPAPLHAHLHRDDVWRQGPSCPSGMGQDRRARTAKFGTAVPCRVATLGKGREASGARPQPETARERTWTYVTEPDSARTQRRAAYRPAPLLDGHPSPYGSRRDQGSRWHAAAGCPPGAAAADAGAGGRADQRGERA